MVKNPSGRVAIIASSVPNFKRYILRCQRYRRPDITNAETKISRQEQACTKILQNELVQRLQDE